MKIGSNVVCVKTFIDSGLRFGLPPITMPLKDTPYTVRTIEYDSNSGRTYIRLNEIINPVRTCPVTGSIAEGRFDILGFRKIDSDISELLEILECKLV